MDQVKVGILGTSWWADAMYLPALKNHPKARVEAVAGRNPETTRAFASRWEIQQDYENAEELIENADIDALIVATSNDSHCPLTLKALERGLHVLCEKPLGLNFPEAAKMASKAKESGVISMVPFTYSFMPATRYLKDLIMEGYLGQPYHLNMRYYGGG
ncbi:MAG TPA: Gfo/Idh/MocA family oxidoreductase, partial [SAR324 cluster bacterium]|nr:Gfo/Idh/MocA family oxidoreductase [SAR324 cluster bacterium]